MHDPNHNPLGFPPPPRSAAAPTPLRMTEAENAAGKNILEEISTSDDPDEIAMLADAYHGLITAACMRLGIVALSSENL